MVAPTGTDASSNALTANRAWRSSHTALRLMVALGVLLLAVLVVLLSPIVLWTANVQAAGQLMEAGLRWPEPRRVDSLPVGRDEKALKAALGHLEAAMRWRPNHPYAYELAGQVYAAQKDWRRSAGSFEAAWRRAPRNPLPAWEASLAYEQMWLLSGGSTEEATRYASVRPDLRMRQWREAAGIRVDELVRRGGEAFEARRYAEALTWYERAALDAPGASEPLYHAGLAYLKLDDPEEALEALRNAATLAPDNRDIWYELGKLHARREERDQALHAFGRAAEASSGTVGLSAVQYRIGTVRSLLLDDPEGAMAAYEQALKLDAFGAEPELKALTFYQRGLVRESQHRWEQAVVEYQQAAALDRNESRFRLSLATALWQVDEHEQAKVVAREVVDLDPDNKAAYRLLGDFFSAEGNRTEARAMYTKVLELDPKDSGGRKGLARLGAP